MMWRCVTILGMSLAMSAALQGDVIALYTFNDDGSGVFASSDADASTVADPVVVGADIDTNNPTTPGGASGIVTSGGQAGGGDNYFWMNGLTVNANSLATAKSNGAFYEIDVTRDAMFNFTSIDSVDFFFERASSNNRTFNFSVGYQLDGTGGFTDVGTTFTTTSADTPDVWTEVQIAVGTIPVTAATDSVQVRLYTWNNSGGSQENRGLRFDTLELNGTLAVIPEPAALTLVGLAGVALLGRRRRRA